MGAIELLVASTIALAALTSAFGLYNTAARSQLRTETHNRTLLQQRRGFEQMVKELRQVSRITLSRPRTLRADVCVTTDCVWQRRIVYWCRPSSAPEFGIDNGDGHDCARFEGQLSFGQPEGSQKPFTRTTVFVADPTYTDAWTPRIFTYQSNSNGDVDYVGIEVEVPVDGANRPIVLNEGVGLRNVGLEL